MTTTPNAPVENTPGWNLLIPVDQLPSWDLLDLYSEIAELVEAQEKATTDKDSIRLMSSIVRTVKAVAVDQDAYTDFARGVDGFKRAMELAIAWLGELGKSFNSAS